MPWCSVFMIHAEPPASRQILGIRRASVPACPFASGGTYKEFDVKLHVLFLLKTDWIESNSFLVRSIQPDCFSALAALTPKGAAKARTKRSFMTGARR